MTEKTVAGVQMDVAFADVERNLTRMEEFLRQTTSVGAWLTVFPECTTTGYCFKSLAEAMPVAESKDGPAFQRIHQLCQELKTHVIYGFLESDGDELFNTISMVGPAGLIGCYRKVHLPMLGIDRFTTPGNSFQVFEVAEVRIGMCICYDSSFPEAARVMALNQADIIVLPTNWPPTSGLTADVIPPARALENHVFFMAINRVGNERGFDFVGKSGIYDPFGKSLEKADHANEAILYSRFAPGQARQKHLVNIPGEHEVHRINDRQPHTYSRIIDA